MLNIFSPTVIETIAWALVDSPWQATLIAVTLSAAHAALGSATARLRHATALAGLLGTVVAFSVSPLGPNPAYGPSFPLSTWIVIGWLVSTLVLLIRLAGGWWLLQRCAVSITNQWDDHLTRLLERFAIARPVTIVQGTSSHVATFGQRRPVIVVPADALAALESCEVDAVLAHELAHVRRHDYATNLFLSAIEAVLFFNPAVWLMTRWARTSREQCCDELAAAVCGGAIEYAKGSWRSNGAARLEDRKSQWDRAGNCSPAFDS